MDARQDLAVVDDILEPLFVQMRQELVDVQEGRLDRVFIVSRHLKRGVKMSLQAKDGGSVLVWRLRQVIGLSP
jgi:hypothetical protein